MLKFIRRKLIGSNFIINLAREGFFTASTEELSWYVLHCIRASYKLVVHFFESRSVMQRGISESLVLVTSLLVRTELIPMGTIDFGACVRLPAYLEMNFLCFVFINVLVLLPARRY